MTECKDTIVDSIAWSWGGWKGRIHPMAFRATLWNMEYCRDGKVRPQVCDTTVPHKVYECSYIKEDEIPVMGPWEAW